jgi:hypothetical protein
MAQGYKIEVDTTEIDGALAKLNQACEKAKELNKLLKDLQTYPQNTITSNVKIDCDTIVKAIKKYDANTIKRDGILIH